MITAVTCWDCFDTPGTKAKPVQESLISVFNGTVFLSDADGSRHAVVDIAIVIGMDLANGMADEAGHPSVLSGYRHPQTQGKIDAARAVWKQLMSKRPSRTDKLAGLAGCYRHDTSHPSHEAFTDGLCRLKWKPSPRAFHQNKTVGVFRPSTGSQGAGKTAA